MKLNQRISIIGMILILTALMLSSFSSVMADDSLGDSLDTSNDEATCTSKEELEKTKISVRYDFYFHNIEVKRIRMNVVIAELENYDNSELVSAREDFMQTLDAAKKAVEARSNDDFDNAVSDAREALKKYKEASTEILDEDEDLKSEINEKLDGTMIDNEDYLNRLLGDALDNQLEFRLQLYEAVLCPTKKAVYRYDVVDQEIFDLLDELEEQLDDLAYTLSKARQKCMLDKLASCKKTEATDAKKEIIQYKKSLLSLRAALKSHLLDLRDLRKQDALESLKKLYAKSIEATEKAIKDAKASGIDTSELEDIQAEFDSIKEEYEELADDNYIDVEDLEDALKDIKDRLKELRKKLAKMKSIKRNSLTSNANIRSIGTSTGDVDEKSDDDEENDDKESEDEEGNSQTGTDVPVKIVDEEGQDLNVQMANVHKVQTRAVIA